jgi:hypothetical protein
VVKWLAISGYCGLINAHKAVFFNEGFEVFGETPIDLFVAGAYIPVV